MAVIIGVRFKSGGKQYYFDPGELRVEPGQGVILETSRGVEYGECIRGNTEIPDEQTVAPLRPVLRIATEEDLETVRKNREREERAFRVCQQKIIEHELDMKLVEVEYSFDGSKVLFFFTSDGRVDFRGLVKDLAAIFHTRIELRQIGVRDEAKMLGGLGICGKPFCCATFLDDFQPVSIKMAKTQNLSLNPTKISGTCGRLMCCLKYEQDAYEDAVRRCPKMESFVETPDGVGTVTGVNLLREQIKVRLEDSADLPKCYHNCEICVVRNGKGKRPEDYIAPPAEELAKRRRVQEKKDPTAAPMNGQSFSRLAGTPSAVSSAPAPKDRSGDPQAPARDKSGRRNRGRGQKPEKKGPAPTGERPEGQRLAPPPKPMQAQRPAQAPKAAQPAAPSQAAPVPGGGEKKPSHRRRWRGKPKPSGEIGK